MKKQIIWLSALFAVLVLSGCGKKATQTNNPNKPTGENPPAVETKEEAEGELFSGSIQDLVAKGENVQCTWSSGIGSSKSGGTIYVSGNKFFQEFFSIQKAELQTGSANNAGESARADEEKKSYMLGDGDWMYSWGSSLKMGMKVNMAEVKKIAEEAKQKNTEKMTEEQKIKNIGGDFNSEFDYHCQKWEMDLSKFQVPSDINFIDPAQMMKVPSKAVSE